MGGINIKLMQGIDETENQMQKEKQPLKSEEPVKKEEKKQRYPESCWKVSNHKGTAKGEEKYNNEKKR